MVSGFVIWPWDHVRIFSGEARLTRILSKINNRAYTIIGTAAIQGFLLEGNCFVDSGLRISSGIYR